MLGADAEAVEPWESVAKRTREVAQKWRALHASEEERANEAEHANKLAMQLTRRAESERDTALKKAAASAQAAAAARQELAKWRARSAAQTASRVFLELESARAVIAERDAELVAAHRALAAAHHEMEAFKASCVKEDAEQKNAARERLEKLMLNVEDAGSDLRSLRATNERLRGDLGEQLANYPPGALESSKRHAARLEAFVEKLEKRCAMLRRDSAMWQERARAAIASERLVQLHSGDESMTALGTPRHVVTPRSGRGRASVAFAGSGGGWGGGRSEADEDEIGRLRAEVNCLQDTEDNEKTRLRAFQQALWNSDGFTLVQKQKVMSWLRDPPIRPDDAYLTAGLPDVDGPGD